MTMQNPERVVTKQDLRDFYDGIYKYLGGGGSSGGSNNVIDAYYNSTDGLFYEESTFETEITGEEKIIYQDISSNKQFRWDGSHFVQTNTLSREISKAEFDELTQEEKDNGTTYYIYDSDAVRNVTIMGNRFDKANIYTATERMIGSYLGKPLYQKTIDCGALPNTTTKSVAHNISNADMIFIQCGFAYASTGSIIPIPYGSQVLLEIAKADNIKITTTSNYSAYTNSYVIVRYTKTTDGTISVGGPQDYSTNEMIIGTWIDSKPLYQKTFTGTIPDASSSTSAGTSYIDITNLNVDICVNCYGTDNGAGPKPNLPYIGVSAEYALLIWCEPSNSRIVIRNFNPSKNGSNVYITIQYTKTTD